MYKFRILHSILASLLITAILPGAFPGNANWLNKIKLFLEYIEKNNKLEK
jgi:hypothetical protein